MAQCGKTLDLCYIWTCLTVTLVPSQKSFSTTLIRSLVLLSGPHPHIPRKYIYTVRNVLWMKTRLVIGYCIRMGSGIVSKVVHSESVRNKEGIEKTLNARVRVS